MNRIFCQSEKLLTEYFGKLSPNESRYTDVIQKLTGTLFKPPTPPTPHSHPHQLTNAFQGTFWPHQIKDKLPWSSCAGWRRNSCVQEKVTGVNYDRGLLSV